MSHSPKIDHSPNTVTLPSALAPIMQMFSLESENTAESLLDQIVSAVYGESNYLETREISQQERECIYSLIRSVKPKDTLEAICGAQIIVGHLLGLRKLSQSLESDKRLGLKLLQFSNEAAERLIKKRGGGQNINVTYNHIGISS